MFVAIYNESDKTIRNNIEELAQEGELGDCKIFQRRINIEDLCGIPHPTTIYNLNVLNRLGMCCFRKNKKAKEVRKPFIKQALTSCFVVALWRCFVFMVLF